MQATIHITPKAGIRDPQGEAIAHALVGLGFESVRDVRQGKILNIELDETDAAHARAELDRMCQRLLANDLIEDYQIESVG